MQSNHYVLSFDPGGSSKTFAYSVCKVVPDFQVMEAGFAPVVEEIARPNFNELRDFKLKILDKYEGRIDLVAERFMSRGFVSFLMESVGFHLGWWSGTWERGTCRLIMPAQWKKELKKKPLCDAGRYTEWWEHYWCGLLSAEELKKKTVHVQDAVAMAYWYATFKKELNLPINLPTEKDVNKDVPCKLKPTRRKR